MEINSNLDFWTGKTLLIDKPFKWTSFDVVNKLRIAISQTYTPRKKNQSGSRWDFGSFWQQDC